MRKSHVNEGYIELIKDKVKILKGDYSISLMKEIFKTGTKAQIISKNPLYELMKDQFATSTTLNIVAQYLDITYYRIYLEQQKKNNVLAKGIVGNWMSYRFDSSRRLRISYWTFKYEESFNFFEVEKRSNREVYRGKFYINEDSLFTGKLKHKDTSLHYTTYFKSQNNIKVLPLNLTYNMENETYFSREVIYKMNKNIPVPAKGLVYKGEVELSDNDFYDNNINQSYEAYNYLTYMSNHTRINLDEDMWKYKHNMFVSSPVRSLFGLGKSRFNEIKDKVEKIINKLTEPPFNFERKHIHNELSVTTYEQNRNENRVFKSVQKSINSTHFISILPPDIKKLNSSCYFEIYYRIAKKMPCLVLYDISIEFPHTLKGFVENNGQNNIRFKPIKFDEISDYFDSLEILDLNIF